MRPNRLKRLWASGGAAVNGWLAIPSSFSAETMAHQGWDSLTVDLQHGMIDYATGVPMLQAISTTAVTPLARVPWLEEGICMKMLDAGCYGIICPMINGGADAERFVAACRYPPRGQRSFGPIRANLYGGPDYAAKANEEIVLFAMIETRSGLDHLDEILSVPGLDAVYIGPADLSNALGCTPKFDQDEKPVVEAIEFIVRRTRERGLVAGIHNGTPRYALSMIELGFQFVTIASDARLMAAKAGEVVAETRRGLEQKPAVVDLGRESY
ncbi:MAG: 4-hydroxy-2-oxoheptanedioate aldolase [Rhodospirillaceae bacterium]|jgi:4-hydroxy-2-oxoheptanedioate aldolase|nr:4-hydroxy-2-oxoheptanedioate aldolase [Rhodospirillaceae bacterium]